MKADDTRIARTSRAANTDARTRRLDWRHHVDLAAGVLLALVALVAALSLPPGGWTRVVLVAPLVLAVPGYLLIQAVMGHSSALERRPMHAVFALGVTPAVMGLLGLGTAALLPGGFQPMNVLVSVTVFCLLAAVIASTRRLFPRQVAEVADGGAVGSSS